MRLEEPHGQRSNVRRATSEGAGAGIGDTPRALVDPSKFTFLTMTTKPRFRAAFKAGGGGRAAVSMARRINTREGAANGAVVGGDYRYGRSLRGDGGGVSVLHSEQLDSVE